MTLETLVSNIERAEYDWSDICAVKEPACESRLSPISRLAVQTSHDSTTQNQPKKIFTEENKKTREEKIDMNTKTKPTTAAEQSEAPRKLAAGFDAIDANLESPAERKINADSTLYPHILGADSQKACDEFTYGKSQGKPEAPQVNRKLRYMTRVRLTRMKMLIMAAKPAHTPGPWKIDENEELPLAVIQDNEDGEGVCEIGKPGSTAYSATPEQWANARLIAAAPELLNFVKAVVNFYGMCDEDKEGTGGLGADERNFLIVGRAAIAAAEGSE